MPTHPPTIFVQIASYRDPECKHTIDDLFKTAARPERVFVGVHWQYEDDEQDIPHFEASYAAQVRIIKTRASEAKGICWARNVVQTLYSGEGFTLQLDAHMRFVEGWDEAVLKIHSELQEAGFAKPVLTHYPPDYVLDSDERSSILKRVAPFPTAEGVFVNKRTGHIVDLADARPFLTTSLCAGFIFAEAKCIAEVPYDPHLYSLGEEISLSARFWTNGWDLFNPGQIIAYHLYRRVKDRATGVIQTPRTIIDHRKDHADAGRRNRISIARAKHLLGTETSYEPEVLSEIDAYGLGKVRTIDQYERFSGLSFRDISRRTFARAAWYFAEKIPAGAQEERRCLIAAESAICRLKCEKAGAVVKLMSLLKQRSVIDIGCSAVPGTMQSAPDPLRDISYLGTTISGEQASAYRQRLRSSRSAHISELNPIAEPLPKCDLVILDHAFTSLQKNLLWQILENIQRSGARYLGIIGPAYHPFLNAQPFLLPLPVLVSPIADSNHMIALWEISPIGLLLEAIPERLCGVRRRLFDAISSSVELLRTAFDRHLFLYRELLAAAVEVNGAHSKEVLSRPETASIIREAGADALAAREIIMGLRWRQPNNWTSTLIDDSPEQSLLGMILTCEYLERALAHTLPRTAAEPLH